MFVISFSKKRKVDNECRVFQQEWTSKYFFFEVSESIAVLKDYNLSRQFQTKHAEKCRNMSHEQTASALKELPSRVENSKDFSQNCVQQTTELRELTMFCTTK
jgi:hypothetical protein